MSEYDMGLKKAPKLLANTMPEAMDLSIHWIARQTATECAQFIREEDVSASEGSGQLEDYVAIAIPRSVLDDVLDAISTFRGHLYNEACGSSQLDNPQKALESFVRFGIINRLLYLQRNQIADETYAEQLLARTEVDTYWTAGTSTPGVKQGVEQEASTGDVDSDSDRDVDGDRDNGGDVAFTQEATGDEEAIVGVATDVRELLATGEYQVLLGYIERQRAADRGAKLLSTLCAWVVIGMGMYWIAKMLDMLLAVAFSNGNLGN